MDHSPAQMPGWRLLADQFRENFPKPVKEIFRIRIVLPVHQVTGFSIRAEVVSAPDKIRHCLGHLLVGEAEAEAAAG